MNATHHIDPVWEDDIYSKGSMRTRYPYDTVISFVHRMRPRTRSIAETSIVEVGCGSANNLWFAAREGFQVSGIDGSTSAIQYANERFKTEGLTGDLRVGDFTTLPWADESHDLAIDRQEDVFSSTSMATAAPARVPAPLFPTADASTSRQAASTVSAVCVFMAAATGRHFCVANHGVCSMSITL
jgi:SAM-dependent methyltransferase